jgi:hypothetical protein
MLAGTLILLSGGMCALQQQTTPWRRGVDNISDLIMQFTQPDTVIPVCIQLDKYFHSIDDPELRLFGRGFGWNSLNRRSGSFLEGFFIPTLFQAQLHAGVGDRVFLDVAHGHGGRVPTAGFLQVRQGGLIPSCLGGPVMPAVVRG